MARKEPRGKSPEPTPELTPISTIRRLPLRDPSGTEQWHNLTTYRAITRCPHTTGPILKDTIAEKAD